MSGKARIQFDLLSNARDSLRQAVELLAWKGIGDTQSRLKHAVTHSAHCVELLLKERLRQVHPAFVWENIDQYPDLTKRTVNVDTAISRLETIGQINFAASDKTNLKSLRNTRNAIEHYEWRTTEKEAKVIIGNALSFALSFASDELKIDLAAEHKEDDTWRSLIDELYEFVRTHGARLAAKLRDRGQYPLCCDNCGEVTVPLGSRSCELCGHWQDIDEDDP